MAQRSRSDTKVARSPIYAPRLQSSASLPLLQAQLFPLCGATLLLTPTIQCRLTWCWHFHTFAAQRRASRQCPLLPGSAFVVRTNIHTALEQHCPSHLPSLHATGSSYYRSAQIGLHYARAACARVRHSNSLLPFQRSFALVVLCSYICAALKQNTDNLVRLVG